MPNLFRENLLVSSAILLLLIYAVLNLLITPIDLRVLAAFLLTFFAIMHCSSWFIDAMKVIRSGIMDSDHLSLLGLWMVSMGAAGAGAYSMSWNFFGRPIEWTQSPVSGIYPIFPMIQAFGFMILSFVPMNKSISLKSPSFLIYLFSAVTLVSVGYLFGATASEPIVPARPSFLR